MNSFDQGKLDARLDQLLESSVGPHAVPAGLNIGPMPVRPKFNWVLLVGACLGVGLCGFAAARWLISLNYTELLAACSGSGMSSDWLSTVNWQDIAGQLSTSTLLSGLIGVIVIVAALLPEKWKTLAQEI
jgi:hypothetical protein